MAGVLDFLSAGVFHKSLKVDESAVRWQNGLVSKLHAATGALFGLFTCTVFAKELVGDHMRCIRYSDDSHVSESTFNSYCYISDTFTLAESDPNHPYHGVGPVKRDQDVVVHAYYQWIPYLFFMQALSFYIPYSCYKFSHDGRLGRLLQDLQNVIPHPEDRDDKLGDIHYYLQDFYGSHNFWAARLIASDALNLINIVINILVMQWYLGSNFLIYGAVVIRHLMRPDELNGSPFDKVFPKMTKCSLEMYGPSGTLQHLDGLCVLPINVLNEKLFFILWLWLLPLLVMTMVEQVLWIFTIINKKHRYDVLCRFIIPKDFNLKCKLRRLMDSLKFGDWLLLYMIARNIDRPLFTSLLKKIDVPKAGYYPEETELDDMSVTDKQEKMIE